MVHTDKARSTGRGFRYTSPGGRLTVFPEPEMFSWLLLRGKMTRATVLMGIVVSGKRPL